MIKNAPQSSSPSSVDRKSLPKPYLSPKALLTEREHARQLLDPNELPLKAALCAATALTTSRAPILFDFLATGKIITWGRSVLFDIEASPDRRAEILRSSDDLAEFPPEFFFSVDPHELVPAVLPANRVEIEQHCKGLISRPGRAKGDDYVLADALPVFWSALGFDWKTHISSLDRLRVDRPEFFGALIGQKIEDAWPTIHAVSEVGEQHALVRVAMCQWLLHCAWHLQFIIAFIAASRRAATPEPFRSLCGVGDTTVAAALAWVSSFATSSAAHLKFYGLPGAPPLKGPRSLPVAFLNAALKPQWWRVDVPLSAKKSDDAALAPHALKIAGRVPAVLRMVDSTDRRGACRHSRLYREARLSAFKRNHRRTLFSNWNFGLSPAAMLLLVVRRFLDGAAICAEVCANPDILFEREALMAIATSLSQDKIRLAADELGAELTGDWHPALENINVPLKLAAAFQKIARAKPQSAAAIYFAWLDPLSLLIDLRQLTAAARRP